MFLLLIVFRLNTDLWLCWSKKVRFFRIKIILTARYAEKYAKHAKKKRFVIFSLCSLRVPLRTLRLNFIILPLNFDAEDL
jgi:hypothetical protein